MSIAALSVLLSVLAFTPPVPSLVMAAMASAGTVRAAWSVAPARTVATFVVERTEAADTVAARREIEVAIENFIVGMSDIGIQVFKCMANRIVKKQSR